MDLQAFVKGRSDLDDGIISHVSPCVDSPAVVVVHDNV
jgi:hypothetical protein